MIVTATEIDRAFAYGQNCATLWAKVDWTDGNGNAELVQEKAERLYPRRPSLASAWLRGFYHITPRAAGSPKLGAKASIIRTKP